MSLTWLLPPSRLPATSEERHTERVCVCERERERERERDATVWGRVVVPRSVGEKATCTVAFQVFTTPLW